MSSGEKQILNNRAAFFEYHIEDTFEAGAVLHGTEVKSIMNGRIQLKESYVAIKDNEVWLMNAHVSPYKHGNINNHEPLRTRKLLLQQARDRKTAKGNDAEGNDACNYEDLLEKRAHKIRDRRGER